MATACNEKETSTPVQTFDEPGFEIIKLNGDLSKAVRKDRHGHVIEEGYLKNKLKNFIALKYVV